MDAARRRPWIDWIHTARDQGALVRNYTKWDDQPASVAAAQEALVRAWQVAATAPCGPVYVNLDAAIQEEQLAVSAPVLPVARYAPPPPPAPDPAALAAAANALRAARRGVMMVGRVSRSVADWDARVALAEASEAVRGMLAHLEGDELVGAHIALDACLEPMRSIARNAGEEGAVVVAKVRSLGKGVGYDAAHGTYVNMVEAGILDPLLVTKGALEAAFSVAGTALLTEAGVTSAGSVQDES